MLDTYREWHQQHHQLFKDENLHQALLQQVIDAIELLSSAIGPENTKSVTIDLNFKVLQNYWSRKNNRLGAWVNMTWRLERDWAMDTHTDVQPALIRLIKTFNHQPTHLYQQSDVIDLLEKLHVGLSTGVMLRIFEGLGPVQAVVDALYDRSHNQNFKKRFYVLRYFNQLAQKDAMQTMSADNLQTHGLSQEAVLEIKNHFLKKHHALQNSLSDKKFNIIIQQLTDYQGCKESVLEPEN